MPADMSDYFGKRRNRNGGFDGGGGGDTPDFLKNLGKKAGWLYAVLAIIVVLIVARPFAIIKSGEVGILVTLGKFQEEPLRDGLHFIMPFIQQVIAVDVKVRVTNYTRSDELTLNRRAPIGILDFRGLPVEVELTVQYSLRPDTAPIAIKTLGLDWEEKTINPNARDVVRSVIGNYSAEQLPVERNAIARLIEEGMTKRMDKVPGNPVKLVSIQLRGIQLPPKVQEQIQRVQIAKQEEERTRNEVKMVQQAALKVQEEARGIAEAKKIEAEGIAQKIAIEARSQAEANILLAKSLTPQLIVLKQIQVQGKFNDALRENKNATIFLTPGGSTPNIWVDTKDKQRTAAITQ